MASRRTGTQIPFKKPPSEDPAQSARFVETAKVAGATSGGLFARALKKIVPVKRPKKASRS
jgi:hypothetical protein